MWSSATPGPVSKADCLASLDDPGWAEDAGIASREQLQHARLLLAARSFVEDLAEDVQVSLALSGHVHPANRSELVMLRVEENGRDVAVLHVETRPELRLMPRL